MRMVFGRRRRQQQDFVDRMQRQFAKAETAKISLKKLELLSDEKNSQIYRYLKTKTIFQLQNYLADRNIDFVQKEVIKLLIQEKQEENGY